MKKHLDLSCLQDLKDFQETFEKIQKEQELENKKKNQKNVGITTTVQFALFRNTLKDQSIKSCLDDVTSITIHSQDPELFICLGELEGKKQFKGKTITVDTRLMNPPLQIDPLAGYHYFSAQLAEWLSKYAKELASFSLYLDGMGSNLTETDLQLFSGQLSEFTQLESLDFSTGGKTAMELWSGGNFEEAHYYVKKKVTVNDKKTLRFAARQLAKALPKLALNNSQTLTAISLDLYRWFSCTSAEASILFKSIQQVISSSPRLQKLYISLYGWVSVINYQCLNDLTEAFRIARRKTPQLSDISLHFPWCESLSSWQACVSLSDALKELSFWGRLKHLTVNLGGWGKESSVVPESLFESLAAIPLGNQSLESLVLTFGNWKNPLRIETTCECLEAMLMKICDLKGFYKLGLDLWGWTSGSLKGLVNISRALVRIRQTTPLKELMLNFWEWSGIINPECAIDVLIQVINPPRPIRELVILSLNINAWYLSQETALKLFKCLTEAEKRTHFEALNLSCLFNHPRKPFKFNNPNGQILARNFLNLIAFKDTVYKTTTIQAAAMEGRFLYLTEKMKQELFTTCFIPNLNEISNIKKPLSYNIQTA